MARGVKAGEAIATIDEYLAGLTTDKRAALEKLRRNIHAAAPGAEECISYRLPALRLGGRPLVWFGASSNHCAFYPGAYPIRACQSDLATYDTSKGTVRFKADSPLPATLVTRLVKARIREIADAVGRPSDRRKALSRRVRV